MIGKILKLGLLIKIVSIIISVALIIGVVSYVAEKVHETKLYKDNKEAFDTLEKTGAEAAEKIGKKAVEVGKDALTNIINSAGNLLSDEPISEETEDPDEESVN